MGTKVKPEIGKENSKIRKRRPKRQTFILVYHTLLEKYKVKDILFIFKLT